MKEKKVMVCPPHPSCGISEVKELIALVATWLIVTKSWEQLAKYIAVLSERNTKPSIGLVSKDYGRVMVWYGSMQDLVWYGLVKHVAKSW